MSAHIAPSDSYIRFLVPPIPQPAPTHIKKLLAGYNITDILGSGGFATVYRAIDSNGRKVAIKVPKMDDLLKTLDMAVIEKFQFESDIWKKLQHEHIVDFYDSSTTPPHISMELMEGGDLASLMKNHRLTVGEAVRIMQHILEGISYAHRMASVHRDLKPENILFTKDGVAKITDWGIGKYMASEGITKTIETKGTLAYSSPEQFDVKKYGSVDWQTDVFQLGVMFYEMLTGVNPFSGPGMAEIMGKVLNYDPEPPSSLNRDIPPELDEIIVGALEKDKKKRWDSGAVMLHEMKGVVEGKGRVKRVKGVGGKEQSKRVMKELKKHFDLLRNIGVDTSGFEREMTPIEKYAKLMWYRKVIERGNVLLAGLKERYRVEMERHNKACVVLMEKIRELFEECLSRELDIEHIYDANKKAMEAFEGKNYLVAGSLFR